MNVQTGETPPWLIGLDEAGYGPNLGPLVVAAVRVRWLGDGDWKASFKKHSRGIRGKNKALPLVDDSKKAYLKEGVEGLERTVARFFPSQANLGDFLKKHCEFGFEELSAEPWFLASEQAFLKENQPDEPLVFPGFEQFDFRLAVLSPRLFNEMTDRLGNKGLLLSHALSTLCRAFAADFSSGDKVFGLADKHGGRNQYAPVLQTILDRGFFLSESESPIESLYKSVGSEVQWRFHVSQKADSLFPLVGLSSMVAKWTRERLMAQFNRYWQEKVPDLAPTAGYPADAPRFFSAITDKARELCMEKSMIWRNR